MYIEEAIKEIKNEIKVGVIIGGQNVIVLRFADEIAFCKEKENFQILYDKTKDILESYKMKVNKIKIKGMTCSKLNKKWLNINIKNEPIEQVQRYCAISVVK